MIHLNCGYLQRYAHIYRFSWTPQNLNLFECKAVHGNTLNFKSDIRENQWKKLLEYSQIPGVNAGIIVWFIDLDKTFYIPIWTLEFLKNKLHKKSFHGIDDEFFPDSYKMRAVKKQVFFEYDLDRFLKEIEYA